MMYCIRPIDSHFSRQFEIWDAHVVFSTVQQDVCLRETKKKIFSLHFLVCLFTELNLCFTFSLLNLVYIRQQDVLLFIKNKQTYFKSACHVVLIELLKYTWMHTCSISQTMRNIHVACKPAHGGRSCCSGPKLAAAVGQVEESSGPECSSVSRW